jgi:hypothetical protein
VVLDEYFLSYALFEGPSTGCHEMWIFALFEGPSTVCHEMWVFAC